MYLAIPACGNVVIYHRLETGFKPILFNFRHTALFILDFGPLIPNMQF